MPNTIRRILLVQLPVPPPGAQTMEGNVPLAAAFLKLYARRQGIGTRFRDRHFSAETRQYARRSRTASGRFASVGPTLVGFTCYVWNIERSLWLAEQIKRARPEVKILLGGPEITADNRWVLENRGRRLCRLRRRRSGFRRVARVDSAIDGDANAIIAGCGETGVTARMRTSIRWMPFPRRISKAFWMPPKTRRCFWKPSAAAAFSASIATIPNAMRNCDICPHEQIEANLASCDRTRRERSLSARSDDQSASRFRRFSAASGPLQSRAAIDFLRRIAGGRDRRAKRRSFCGRRISRNWKSACNRSNRLRIG